MRPLTRFTAAQLAIWVSAVAALFVWNGFHYDLHALTLGIALFFGSGMIVGASYLLSLWLKERDRAEALLRQSQERYSSLVENSLTGIFISQDGLIRFSNARFAEAHGLSPAAIVGRDAFELVHPDDRAELKRISERLLSGELDDDTYELRCVIPDGSTIWVQRRSRRVLHEGRPAILVNEIDITEQKVTAARLRDASEQIKRLLERFLRQQEVDRREIASEIQEDFAQNLNAVKMRIESLMAQVEARDGDAALDSVRPIVADVQQTVKSIRRLAQKLYPMAVDTFGIVAALRWLFDSVIVTHPDFRIRSHLDVEDALVPNDLKVAAFRMVEKILAEVIRDTPAGTLAVYLQGFGSKVMLAVKAEMAPGRAPGDPASPESLEVADFRTRVESCGGQFSLSHRGDEHPHLGFLAPPCRPKGSVRRLKATGCPIGPRDAHL